ncbi:MAG TPA: hypothetical protein VF526_09810 [Solirubrobacteraceae bacterium]
MEHRRLLVIVATAAALVVPAGAAQASDSSFVSANAKVKIQVAKAHKAVARLKVAVWRRDGVAAAAQLKIARELSAAASVNARRMNHRSTSKHDSAIAAAALVEVATEYEDLLETITDLVDEITGPAQELLAEAILPTIEGRDGVLDSLADILDEVPEAIEETLATVFTALSLDDATELLNLRDAMKGGDLPDNVLSLVTDGLESATDSLDGLFDTVEEIVELLPKPIRKPIAKILDCVDDTTEQLTPEVLETVTELIDSILDTVPLLGDESIGLDHLLGDDLLGELLGGDLLEGILGDDNGDGGLLGINELIDELLGGHGHGHGHGDGLLGGLLGGDGHGDGGLLGGVLGGDGHGEGGLLGGVLGGDDGIIESVTELVENLLEGIL